MRARLVFIIPLLTVLASPQVSMAAEEDHVLLSEIVESESTWAVFDLWLDAGAEVSVGIEFDGAEGFSSGTAQFITPDWEFAVTNRSANSKDRVEVRVSDRVVMSESESHADFDDFITLGSGGGGLSTWSAEPTWLTAVVYAVAEEVDQVTITVTGSGVTLRDQRTDDAFLYVTDDFDATAHAAAADDGIGARLDANGTIELPVEGTLFGQFGDFGFFTSGAVLTSEEPGSAPKLGEEWYLGHDNPGNYRFNIAAGAAGGLAGHIALYGADIPDFSLPSD